VCEPQKSAFFRANFPKNMLKLIHNVPFVCLYKIQSLNSLKIPDAGFHLYIELFKLNSTLNFGIPTVLVFQLEVYYKVDRLLTGLTAQQKGTTARWYSNKTSL